MGLFGVTGARGGMRRVARRTSRRTARRQNRWADDTASTADPAGDDVTAQLEKLGELHDRGVLTDQEFEAKKADLLDRM